MVVIHNPLLPDPNLIHQLYTIEYRNIYIIYNKYGNGVLERGERGPGKQENDCRPK